MRGSSRIRAVLYGCGAVVGGVVGWSYWRYVGCTAGGCAITSDPVNSLVYGVIMGIAMIGVLLPQRLAGDTSESGPDGQGPSRP